MEALIEKGKSTIESILSVKENVAMLENKIEELSCRERDVQAELLKTLALYEQKPKSEVELWLKKVERIKIEVPDIKQKLGELRWFHFREQMDLAKCVEEKIKEIAELRANGQFLNGLFVNSLATKKFPLVTLVGETTALKSLKMIEDCLKEDEVGKIGVFGMGGVGKTTLTTQIYNKIKNANTFDRVIWVTVSRDSYLEKLQYDVSKALCVNLSNDHAIDRSGELFGAFNHIGRFLLILDDMWNAFPLEKIGIPEPNKENKSKIVWTTRSKKVCRGMGSHKLIEVEGLKEDESWKLFEEKLGANVSPELEPIAKGIVKECDGLPLAIITVGAAMRDVDDIRIWRTALEDLRNSSTEIIEGMEDEVFTCLKFSFDKLKSQTFRDCFLYCALFPEDWVINCKELIDYWMADGLLDENEDREKGFDKGYTIINHLKDACLLESSMFGTHVKMHDLLRDLAINITRKSPRFVVKAGFRVKQLSWDENLMTGAVRVSLMDSNIEMLSCQPKSCSELSTLLLQGFGLVDIHHLFFENMYNLRVLDLSKSGIMYLPQSISNLGKLRALLLRYCTRLEKVPSLAKLKELRMLNLSDTSIKCLPEGLEGLTKLRCLNLRNTKKLESFPAGIILNLSYLEELDMHGCKFKWSSNGHGGGACVEEMLRLTHLRKFYIGFAHLNAFNCYVESGHWRQLKYFAFYLDYTDLDLDFDPDPDADPYLDPYLDPDHPNADPYLHPDHLDADPYLDPDPNADPNLNLDDRLVSIRSINDMSSLVFPDNTLSLDIKCSNDRISLSEIPSMWNLKQLTRCSISWCMKMEYILTKDQENPFLPTLNELSISELLNLRSICQDPMPNGGGSLAHLKTIKITVCPNLKYIFSVRWLQALQNLENIYVNSCIKVEEMVVETEDMGESSNNDDNVITLPRLRTLHLGILPKLRSISKRIFVCNALEEIEVLGCPKLKKLPFSINGIPPSLKSIKGSNKWWDSLEWDNSDTQLLLQLFFNTDPYSIDFYSVEDDDDFYSVEDDDDHDHAVDGVVHEEDEEEEKRGTKRKAEELGPSHLINFL